jgi:hypothetical protein
MTMKKLILATACALFLIAPAFAQNNTGTSQQGTVLSFCPSQTPQLLQPCR